VTVGLQNWACGLVRQLRRFRLVLYGHTLENVTQPLRYTTLLESSTLIDRTILTNSYFKRGRCLNQIQSIFPRNRRQTYGTDPCSPWSRETIGQLHVVKTQLFLFRETVSGCAWDSGAPFHLSFHLVHGRHVQVCIDFSLFLRFIAEPLQNALWSRQVLPLLQELRATYWEPKQNGPLSDVFLSPWPISHTKHMKSTYTFYEVSSGHPGTQ
jgi:hypothetical protein